MQLQVHALIKDALQSAARSLWSIEPPEIVLNQTPRIDLGELATPVCFDLAKRLKKSPRDVATALVGAIPEIPGIRKMELAGAGYINFFLDRAVTLRDVFDELIVQRKFAGIPPDTGKIIVEHTNINP